MLVKNIGKKVIGFGSLVLPPDAVDTLPPGFGPEHPVVQFYIGKNWIVEVTNGEVENPLSDLHPQALSLTPSQDDQPLADLNEFAERHTEIEKRLKAIGKMTLEQLRVEATNLDIVWAEFDNKAVIQQKITEKLQA